MISTLGLWEKGIIWEWRARRLGCFLVGRRNVGAGGSRRACFNVHVCIRSRQESLTPTDSGSTYQGLNKEGEGGEGSGYPALSHPPLTPITPSLELSHIHTGRDEH